ncbi:MFS transporter [Agrobacterium fabrum]|uniref:MFS permease n=2 Tax=Agrobacterium fabrum TaxID=1176649 RepID=Q7D040_AGRFC|nr:MFS permease [Agrobacterium fabrum str. C58]QRM59592.1 MFS transporter [Agrobacterium fabrum]TRB31016.1 MFS transporter [Agrobacterium fabrum]
MFMSQATRQTMPWLIIAAGSLIAVMTFGPRSAMGFFQLPMLADTGWDRSTFGLAMALQNLFWGLGQPFFGAIADKYGTGRVLVLSGILYAAGLVCMSFGTSPFWLHFGGGVLVGLGIAAGSFSVILSAFARHVTPQQRSLAFGIGTAAGSAGMFLFAPISQGLISAYGWSDSLVWLAAMMVLVPLLAWPMRGNSSSGSQSQAQFQQTVGEALKEALGHKSYLLLTTGFFVCGFQVAFITAHFPAYLGDIGIEPRYAVIAMALIGFFNIIGSLAAGVIAQRYSKPYLLAYIYIARSVVVTAFLLLPQSPLSVILFASFMGILWLSTVPPTNALVAIMFGTRHLGMLGGVVFLTHQIGSFLGVWLGGFLYDRFGTYDIVWWLGVGMGIFAAIVHWPIQERPAPRPVMA